jgi:hypothetical protein
MQKLFDSYRDKQNLKLQGQDVSGAYDTFDIETPDGSVQFGYNYIGRESGTNDDSKVVFWVSTDKEEYSTRPNEYSRSLKNYRCLYAWIE